MNAFSDETEQGANQCMALFKGRYQWENMCRRNQSNGGSSGGAFAQVAEGI